VDFAKPPAAGEKKKSAKPPVQRQLILPTLTTSDKFNVSPVEKTKYCHKSDSRRDSDNINVSDGILLTKLNRSRKPFCVQLLTTFKIGYFLLS